MRPALLVRLFGPARPVCPTPTAGERVQALLNPRARVDIDAAKAAIRASRDLRLRPPSSPASEA